MKDRLIQVAHETAVRIIHGEPSPTLELEHELFKLDLARQMRAQMEEPNGC